MLNDSTDLVANSWPSHPAWESADVGGLVRRHWHIVLAGVALGISLALAYYFVASTKYQSSAQILIMKKDSGLPIKGVEDANDKAVQIPEDLLATHMQIVQSPRIVRTGLQEKGLEGLESIQRRLARNEDEVDYIINHLKVSRGGSGQARLGNVLNVSFRHVSDEECQSILTAIVDSYQSFLADRFRDVGQDAVKLIDKTKSVLQADLETAETEYREFREHAPLFALAWNGEVSATTNPHRLNVERLQTALSELRLGRATAQTRLDTVRRSLAKAGPGMQELDALALLDDTHVQRLGLVVNVKRGAVDSEEFQATLPGRSANARAEYENLLELTQREQSLLVDYGVEHPLVKGVRDQIATTKTFLDKRSAAGGFNEPLSPLNPKSLMKAYVSLLENDLDAIALRQTSVESLAKEEEDAAKELVRCELTGETLRKKVARKQELYDTALDRLRELNLFRDFGGIVTEVIAPVEVGEVVWPKLSLVLLAGGAFGLLLGAGGAFSAEHLAPTLRTTSEVQATLGLPVLMRLPTIRRPRLRPAEIDVAEGIDPMLVTVHRPESQEAEAFRGLRTSLLFSCRDQAHQVILVSGANPGDGKTLIAANLAISLAQAGRNILLVDADLGRPRIHQLFKLGVEVGLSNVIAGQIDPPDAVQSTGIDNLSVVTCGPLTENQSELLTSPRLEQWLHLCRQQFDFVIVDAAPLLLAADPCVLAPLVDAVLFTVRLSRDTRSQVQRSREALQHVHANVIGVLINGVDNTEGRYAFNRYSYADWGYRVNKVEPRA